MTEKQLYVIAKLQHAIDFTKIENSALAYALFGWFANTPKAIKAGDDAWSFTTLLEHFNSKLDQNPEVRTKEELFILKRLEIKAKETQDKVSELIKTGEEDERMNRDLDTYIADLLKQFEKSQ